MPVVHRSGELHHRATEETAYEEGKFEDFYWTERKDIGFEGNLGWTSIDLLPEVTGPSQLDGAGQFRPRPL
ncbi:hypothetical protein R1flu_003061 [Riccia fluitans]|uniref:Uncharacterized protein n=1 Tax=Riccia fluitans TaxID=41844 RepID=A0ABD1Y7Z9_9MARC